MILDEYKIAEQALAENRLQHKKDIFILAKYLRHEVGCNESEAYNILNSIMAQSFSDYNAVKSALYLMKVAKKAANYQLKRIISLGITQQELDTIRTLHDYSKIERLLFTLLVYAKYNNQLSDDNNNNWCNIGINELYKIAKVSTRNAKERGIILHRLENHGFITLSRKNTNLNIRCEFVDDKNEPILQITDLRELGYQYLNLTKSEEFTYCQKCGVIVKKRSKNDFSTRYCSICFNEQRVVQKRNSFQKLDKADMSSDGNL